MTPTTESVLNLTTKSGLLKALRIEDCSRGQDGSAPGYYIVAGHGETYRCFMWAANAKLAKQSLAQIRREIRSGEIQ